MNFHDFGTIETELFHIAWSTGSQGLNKFGISHFGGRWDASHCRQVIFEPLNPFFEAESLEFWQNSYGLTFDVEGSLILQLFYPLLF